jgi:hypothetical protein
VADFQSRPAWRRSALAWADILDEQAFYANGQRYAFDMQLGNVRGRPGHGSGGQPVAGRQMKRPPISMGDEQAGRVWSRCG